MKARCPVQCGRDLGDDNFVLCKTCYAELPQAMRDAIARAALIVRKSRKPNAVAAALRNQREVRTAAVQWVMDRRNERVTA